MTTPVVSTRRRAGTNVEAFALRAEQGEDLSWAGTGVGDAMRDAGVELGDLPCGQDKVVLAEEQAQAACEDVTTRIRRGSAVSARRRACLAGRFV